MTAWRQGTFPAESRENGACVFGGGICYIVGSSTTEPCTIGMFEGGGGGVILE